jgi:hypothetical protein
MRLHLIMFLDKFLIASPYSYGWGAPEAHPSLDEDGDQRITPPTLLQHLLKDVDLRVGFRMAVSAAVVIDLFQRTEGPVEVYFAETTDMLSLELDSAQKMMVRIVCLANMLVVSAYVRRAPYENLVTLTIQSKEYDQHIRAVLEASAVRLGLDSIKIFHTTFVSFVARHCLNTKADFNLISESVLGYTVRKERYEEVFRQLGAIYLQSRGAGDDGMRLFKMLCQATGKDFGAGLRECLPVVAAEMLTVAVKIAFAANATDKAKEAVAALGKALDGFRKLAAHSDLGPDVDAVALLLDKIVVELLLLVYAKDVSRWGPLPIAIEAIQAMAADQKQGAIFYKELIGHANQYRHVQPHDTAHEPVHVMYAAGWLNSVVPIWSSEPVVYVAAQRLIFMAAVCPFVDLQIRYLVSTMVLLAFGFDCLTSAALQRLLLHGYSCLYKDHGSLRDTLWPAMNWLLRVYPHQAMETVDEPFQPIVGIPSIIVRLGNVARKHDRKDDLKGLRSILDQQYSGHATREIVSQGVEASLLLWPDSVQPDFDLQDLFEIAQRCSVPTMHFSLVSAIRCRLVDTSPKSEASKKDLGRLLWQFLANLKAGHVVQAEHGADFAKLLSLCDGQVLSPKLVRPSSKHSDPTSSHLPILVAPGNYTAQEAQAQLTGAIAALMASDDLRMVNAAFLALNRIFALQPPEEPLPNLPDQDANRDIAVVSAKEFRRPFEATRAKNDRSLKELIKSGWTGKARKYSAWISGIARLFLQVIAQGDRFYAQLIDDDILRNDACISLILPTITLTLLRNVEGREHVTTHFVAVLSASSTDPLVARNIVNILLYLRNFPCPFSQNPLSGDDWLQVPWSLVATNALRYGAPLTSLLAVELAYEHQRFDPTKQPDIIRECLFSLSVS